MLTAPPPAEPIDDVLRGVFARLQCEFPEVSSQELASAVQTAGEAAADVLPDLPAFVVAVAAATRSDVERRGADPRVGSA